MKGKKILVPLICTLLLTGCSLSSKESEDYSWENPGDILGGGVDAVEIPESIEKDIEPLEGAVSDEKPETTVSDTTAVPSEATKVTGDTTLKKSASGNERILYLEGEVTLSDSEQIKVNDGATEETYIYLNGVTINKSGSKKALNLQSDTTIVIVDNTTNYIKGSEDSSSAMIGLDTNLTIVGNGTLYIESNDCGIDVEEKLNVSGNPTIEIKSVDDGIKADDICLYGGSYTINSSDGRGIKGHNITILNGASFDITTVDKDAIHAEMSDKKTEFTYDDGYVYIGSASQVNIKTTGQGDGIQADTFVFIKSGNFNIEVNGGAPETVTSRTSNKGEAKAIKAGTIDYEDPDTGKEVELDSIYEYTIAIAGGDFNISSDDDSLHSNGKLYIYGGNIEIATGDDAIHAETDLVIEEGCAIAIDRCYEGIEAQAIQINGGIVSLYAVDDGINAASVTGKKEDKNCQIVINGGEIYVNAEGDGIDSNGGITINGGTISVNGPSTGADAALDSTEATLGSEYGITINGGNLIAIGALGMVETPTTSSSQYVISYATSSKQSANTLISVLDSSDNVILSILSVRQFQSIIVSSPDFVKGETYTFYGGSVKLGSVTISSTITTGGSTQSGNGSTGPDKPGSGGGQGGSGGVPGGHP